MPVSKEDQKNIGPESVRTKRTPVLGLPLGHPKPFDVTLPDDLAVVLAPRAFHELFAYAHATELEVSLLGIVDREGCVFTVREFFLVPQQGGASHTETDPAAIGELIERLMLEGRGDDARKLKCWAHSHPGMDVFWSRTDDDNCRRLCADWLVSIVVSDGFKVRSRVDVASPIPFTVDCVPTFLASPVDEDIAVECANEVKEKIKPMPMLGFGRNTNPTKEETKMKNPNDRPIELMEYCDLCGGWHVEDDCPMQFESSAYELAHQERVMEANDVWGDAVWF